MENEKLIIEMLQKLTTNMDDFKDEIKQEVIGVKQEMTSFKEEMKQEMSSFKTEMREEMTSFKTEMREEMTSFKTEVNARFDQVDNRLDKIEGRLESVEYKMNSMGEMFEHTVKLQQEAIEKVNDTLQYHTHKIAEHDQELFTMKHKQ